MSSHHLSEVDSDSVASSPRSEYDVQPRVRFMCSFGGKILPRPNDNQLRYVGGDTRIVAFHRHTTFSALINKLSKMLGTSDISVKYQLPNEDFDALISVSTDEDVENMMEEYDRVAQNQNSRSARLRLFLFNNGGTDDDSRASSISSLLDSSANREQWFLDALNSGGGVGGGAVISGSGIERGRSEASSLVSDVPDYLFGLDNSEEAQARDPRDLKPKIRREVSLASDPGSLAPVASSPFGSTSSAPAVQELPVPQTKPENLDPVLDPNRNKTEEYPETMEQFVIHQPGYPGNRPWQYSPHPQYPGHNIAQLPVYYVQGNTPVQTVPIQAQYVPQYPVQTGHHMPIGYHHQSQFVPGVGQVYGGTRPVAMGMEAYDQSARVAADGANQKLYYGVTNPGMVHVYHPGMVSSGEEQQQRTDQGTHPGRIS